MKPIFKDALFFLAALIGVYIIVTLFSGCAALQEVADYPKTPSSSPKPAPTATPKPSTSAPSPTGKALAWGNAAWDAKLRTELKEEGMGQVASIADAKTFCPSYSKLTADEKIEFWATLMVAMAKRESGYKPATTYTESFKDSATGLKVVSTGLFQLSQGSTRQARYKCPGVTTESLKGPEQNIGCAVNILSLWVKSDGRAAGASGSNTGCGRYWSVCRPGSSQDYIASQTKALKICN